MAERSKRKVKGKKLTVSLLRSRFEMANDIITRFESEVERTIKSVRLRGKRSGDALRKILDEVTHALGADEFRSKATEKTEEILKEIRRRTDEVVDSIKNFEVQIDRELLANVKDNLGQIVGKVQSLEFVEYVQDKIVDTKNQVLSLLRIPSQSEVDNLARKITSLEKKLGIISKHQKSAA